MPKQKTKVTVIQDDESISFSVLASSIKELSKVGNQLKNSPLNEKAIVLLLQDMTKLSRDDIKKVLNALPLLEKTYLK